MSYGWNGWPEAKKRSEETGMCARCEKHPVSGGTHFCISCRERATEYSQRRREFHKANGSCIQCGHKAMEGKTVCFRCSAKDQRRKTQVRRERKDLGICADCGKAPAAPGGMSCDACREKARARFRARYGSPAENLANGLCHTCGEIPPMEGRKSCEFCLAAAKAHAKRSYRDRIAAGKCGRCGGERDTKYQTCSSCLARKRANRAKKQ